MVFQTVLVSNLQTFAETAPFVASMLTTGPGKSGSVSERLRGKNMHFQLKPCF